MLISILLNLLLIGVYARIILYLERDDTIDEHNKKWLIFLQKGFIFGNVIGIFEELVNWKKQKTTGLFMKFYITFGAVVQVLFIYHIYRYWQQHHDNRFVWERYAMYLQALFYTFTLWIIP